MVKIAKQSIIEQNISNTATLFCIGHLLLCLGPPLSVTIYQCCSLEENYFFSFASGNQMEIAFGLGMEACVQFPSQHWDSI